ncbi:branched-chain amino acid ABC transporter permease [Marivivens niveibacter]|uniref:Branched-chain amino acid ABC transporter permease n=1 Tax=Marivivens niveibacter TaxID=1930667 RepID=A0A251X3X3_9RHOB|nr:branched-chain amino acid ABC transporter permease [Marivivens niveibacter]OUD10853.1 branched-chain amino acid ABC transporter permease [Marivivens niveibacter]
MDFLNALVNITNLLIIPATTYGAQLALGALGVTLIYSILRFSNFAHGDTMAFGTIVTIGITSVFQSWGISLGPLPTALLALPFAVVVTAALLVGTDFAVYRFYRAKRAVPIIFVMASLGVMLMMNGFVRFLAGVKNISFADGERFIIKARDFKEMTGLAEPLGLRTTQVLTVVVAVIIVAWLFWFLNKTRTGKSMRAFSDNEDLALLSGINPNRVVIVTWVIVALLTTTAGVLYGLDKGYQPYVYFQLLLPTFAAAIVGGLGNPLGAIVGGFVVSFSEVMITHVWKKVLTYLMPENLEPSSLMQLMSTEYKFAVSFAILVIVLLFKPTGLFKGQSV